MPPCRRGVRLGSSNRRSVLGGSTPTSTTYRPSSSRPTRQADLSSQICPPNRGKGPLRRATNPRIRRELRRRGARPSKKRVKKDAVRRLLARGSKSVAEIAKELGVSPSMLHRWRERFEPELTGGAQPSQGEREEIERLRRELRDLQADEHPAKKSRCPVREGSEVAMYELIHADRGNIPVARACRVLEVSRNSIFRVTPPSGHRMVVELERLQLIRRQPGVARSIELLVAPALIPALE